MEGDPQLNFPSGGESQMSCADVMISDDLVFENEETFCLTLESSDADVTVGPSGVTCIVISDNDSKTSITNTLYDIYTFFVLCRP